MKSTITTLIQNSIEAKQQLLQPQHIEVIEKIAQQIIDGYKSCKKLVACGNGGSAGDAQHFVAEMVCRFEKDRMALPAIALSTDTSILTSIGNDYGYNRTFSRQVEALVTKGDIVVGISTSGNSPNVIEAMEEAKKLKAVTVGFTGSKECQLKKMVDICFCAPSTVTGRIQECHILAIHIICALVEGALFGDE